MNAYSQISGIKETILNSIEYVAEPHQFSKVDLIDSLNYNAIKNAVEHTYNVVVHNMEAFKMFVNEVVEWFATYDPMVFHI